MRHNLEDVLNTSYGVLGVDKVFHTPSPSACWDDCLDLLPGFSALDRKLAKTVCSNIHRIEYKLAKNIITHTNPSNSLRNEIKNCPGVGFVEITTDDSVLLLSKELRRWFVYRTSTGGITKAHAIAAVLTKAAGWDNFWDIEDKAVLSGGDAPPYFELGSELEREHRLAREVEYASINSIDERPYFVDELLAYYAGKAETHQENAEKYAGEDRQDLLNWESDSLEGALFIRNVLGELSKKGLKKIISAKAKDADYQQVYDKLVALPEVEKRNRLLFTRKHPSVIDEPVTKPDFEEASQEESPLVSDQEPANKLDLGDKPDSQVEPVKCPTNLDHALRHIVRQLRWQKKAYESHEALVKESGFAWPNGHEEHYLKYLEAFKSLKFLRKHGIEWVGEGAGVSEEKLLSNIRKIKAEVERTPGGIPLAGTSESYDYLQKAIDRDEEPFVLPVSDAKPTEIAPEEIKPKEPTAVEPPVRQPIQREWKRAKALLSWSKKNLPALVVGGLTGASVRILGQFALAAFVTTTPGVAVAIGSAVVVGAVAGGASKLLTTSIWGGAKKEEKNWRRKAFLQGAAMGALGAGVGAGVTQWLISHDYLHGLFGHHGPTPPKVHGAVPQPEHAAPPSINHGHPPTGVKPSVPAAQAVPPHGAPDVPKPVVPSPHQPVVPNHGGVTPPPSDTPSHGIAPSHGAATAPKPVVPDHSAAAPSSADAPSHTAAVASSVMPQGSVKNLLTEEQFKSLPRRMRSLASSTNPREVALFCKEASFKLINGPNKSPETLKAGVKLIEHGLGVAKSSGLDNSVTKMLHADLAYMKAWGIGTDKNVEIALDNARQAGTAIHNYGGKLRSLFGRLTNG